MNSFSRGVLAPISLAFFSAARRVEQQAHRDAPIGDGTLRIGLERLLENLLRGAIPERVLVAHAAIEPPLSDLVARGLEVDRAEPLVGLLLGAGRLRERAAEYDGGRESSG